MSTSLPFKLILAVLLASLAVASASTADDKSAKEKQLKTLLGKIG